MHMSKQRMCKEECKKRTLTVPCSGERGTVRVRFFFSLMLHQDIIYMPAMLLQDLIYMIDIYIYICIPQKFHPAGSQETKHIAHAQRETK